jgi:hypothetical protein
MPAFNSVPGNPLDYADVNTSLSVDYVKLNSLEASNVESGEISQRLVDMRSCVRVFGPVSATYTRDWKKNVFVEGVAKQESIPGASVTFDVEEDDAAVQLMFQLSWQALLGPPPEDGDYVFHITEMSRAELRIRVDDAAPHLWSHDHRLPITVSRYTWERRGKAFPYNNVGPSGTAMDVDPARQRTTSGFHSLGTFARGRHHVYLGIWYDGPGIVRVRSSQMAVVVRYR